MAFLEGDANQNIYTGLDDRRTDLMETGSKDFLIDNKPSFGKIRALLIFIYNCSGNSVFTMHMTLSRVGLFWTVTMTAYMIVCICHSLAMLEAVASGLEKERFHTIQIRNSTDTSRHLRVRFMWVVNLLFTLGAVSSVQADGLTDVSLVAANLKTVSDIDPFYTKLACLLTLSALLLIIDEIENHKMSLIITSVIYGILGSLTVIQRSGSLPATSTC